MKKHNGFRENSSKKKGPLFLEILELETQFKRLIRLLLKNQPIEIDFSQENDRNQMLVLDGSVGVRPLIRRHRGVPRLFYQLFYSPDGIFEEYGKPIETRKKVVREAIKLVLEDRMICIQEHLNLETEYLDKDILAPPKQRTQGEYLTSRTNKIKIPT